MWKIGFSWFYFSLSLVPYNAHYPDFQGQNFVFGNLNTVKLMNFTSGDIVYGIMVLIIGFTHTHTCKHTLGMSLQMCGKLWFTYVKITARLASVMYTSIIQLTTEVCHLRMNTTTTMYGIHHVHDCLIPSVSLTA